MFSFVAMEKLSSIVHKATVKHARSDHEAFAYCLQNVPYEPFPLVHVALACNVLRRTLAKNKSLQSTND